MPPPAPPPPRDVTGTPLDPPKAPLPGPEPVGGPAWAPTLPPGAKLPLWWLTRGDPVDCRGPLARALRRPPVDLGRTIGPALDSLVAGPAPDPPSARTAVRAWALPKPRTAPPLPSACPVTDTGFPLQSKGCRTTTPTDGTPDLLPGAPSAGAGFPPRLTEAMWQPHTRGKRLDRCCVFRQLGSGGCEGVVSLLPSPAFPLTSVRPWGQTSLLPSPAFPLTAANKQGESP
jgi:hypothetical protein